MFHANRAHRHQAADSPITGGTSPWTARAGPPERPPTNSSGNHRVITPRRAVAGGIAFRTGLLLLTLVILALLGGPLVAPPPAPSQTTGAPKAKPSSSSATIGPLELAVQPTQTTQPVQTRDEPPLTSARRLHELVLRRGNTKAGEIA